MYERIESADGEHYYIDTDTGRYISENVTYYPSDYICRPISQQQLQQIQEQKEREQFKAYQQTQRAKETSIIGNFIWCKTETDTALTAATLARLIYLSSYLNYNGELRSTQRTPIQRRNLTTLLNLSDSVVSVFLKEVSGYIQVNNGILSPTDAFKTIFTKGGLKNGNYYYKIFCKWVQDLYNGLKPREHRYIGYIFKLLPYINLKYNVICYNPWEEDSDKLERITFDAFCDMCGYGQDKRQVVRKKYDSIRFKTYDNKHEKFCCISDYNNSNGTKSSTMIINPSILHFDMSLEAINQIRASWDWQ